MGPKTGRQLTKKRRTPRRGPHDTDRKNEHRGTQSSSPHIDRQSERHDTERRWAEAHIKIARMTLTIKLDRNWSSFQLANSTPPLSVTGSAIAPSARMVVACAFHVLVGFEHARIHWFIGALLPLCKILDCKSQATRHNQKKSGMAFSRCILFFYLSV